jgi:hypothetical protein
VRVQVGQLPTLIAQHGAGTSFCLDPGIYTPDVALVMEDGDKLIGSGRDVTHIDLSKVPTGPKGGIMWPACSDGCHASTDSISGEVRGLDIYGMRRNSTCAQNTGCGAAIRGTYFMRVTDNRIHDNAWGAMVNYADTYFAGNEVYGNSRNLDGLGFFGVGVGATKVLQRGTFVNNHIHHNGQAGIWWDISGANNFGLVTGNRFSFNFADVVWETSWGRLDAYGNTHEGGAKAYDVSNSANADIHDNNLLGTYQHDEIEIDYNARALPVAECEPLTNELCDGTVPYNVRVYDNTGLEGVHVGEYIRATNTVQWTRFGPNGCLVRDLNRNMIESVVCFGNS